jgi:phospholipase D1/2
MGEHSIYKYLKEKGIDDPSEYITFHGMRNWSVLMGKLVQEIIYVHSKLMIVDDKHVICGSANINDRSMLGKRDSEVASLVKDEHFQESILNGKKVSVGKYAFSLRQKIFKYIFQESEIKDSKCTSLSKKKKCLFVFFKKDTSRDSL